MTESTITPATVDAPEGEIVAYTGGDSRFTAIQTFQEAKTLPEKKALFNALQNAESIRDHLGEKIVVRDIISYPAEVANRDTGVVELQPRTIFIAKDGKSYGSVSPVLYDAVVKLLKVFGDADTWRNELAIRVVEKNGSRGYRYYALELV